MLYATDGRALPIAAAQHNDPPGRPRVDPHAWPSDREAVRFGYLALDPVKFFPFVHRFDKTRAERDVVILDDDLVVRGSQNVRHLLRDGGDRAAPKPGQPASGPGRPRGGAAAFRAGARDPREGARPRAS